MKPMVLRMAAAVGLMIAAISVGLGVPGALARHDDEGDDEDGGGRQFVYAAKVLCPPNGVTTTINVHNPNPKAITLSKKGIALDSGQVPTPPGERKQETLNPDWALQMGCADLAALGAVGPAGFGDVIIESRRELDVWAVYLTGSGGAGASAFGNVLGNVLGTELVRVPATKG